MNYLAPILQQMQQMRNTGFNPAPRWSQTGDNQGWYDMQVAQGLADKQFARDSRNRELDIMEKAFAAPQRRDLSYRSQPFMTQDAPPGGFSGGYGMSMSRGMEPPEGLNNFLATLLNRGGGLRSGG